MSSTVPEIPIEETKSLGDQITNTEQPPAATQDSANSNTLLGQEEVVIPSPESVSSTEPAQEEEDSEKQNRLSPQEILAQRLGNKAEYFSRNEEYSEGEEEEEEEEEEEDDDDDSEVQWEESMNQLVGLLNCVVLPVGGRILGCRVANISK